MLSWPRGMLICDGLCTHNPLIEVSSRDCNSCEQLGGMASSAESRKSVHSAHGPSSRHSVADEDNRERSAAKVKKSKERHCTLQCRLHCALGVGAAQQVSTSHQQSDNIAAGSVNKCSCDECQKGQHKPIMPSSTTRSPQCILHRCPMRRRGGLPVVR